MNKSLIILFSKELKKCLIIKSNGYKSLTSVNVTFSKLSCKDSFLVPYLSCFEQVRHGRQFKRIRGPPRPPLPFKEVPAAHCYEYIPIYPKVKLC